MSKDNVKNSTNMQIHTETIYENCVKIACFLRDISFISAYWKAQGTRQPLALFKQDQSPPDTPCVALGKLVQINTLEISPYR